MLLLGTKLNFESLAIHFAHRKDSDQTWVDYTTRYLGSLAELLVSHHWTSVDIVVFIIHNLKI